MGTGKKPFRKRTKIEQERTRQGLYRHFIEISNRAQKELNNSTPNTKKDK